jgi:hypothetical protein
MANPFKYTEVFCETGQYEPRYVIRHCDEETRIWTCPHVEGATFQQFRVATATAGPACSGGSFKQLMEEFVYGRSQVKAVNGELHHRLYHGGPVPLKRLLNEACDWAKYPPVTAGVKVHNARWLTFDGNGKSFVADDGRRYWFVHWCGS